MCGIAGELSWSGRPDGEAVRRMTDRLSHRGPDAGGFKDLGLAALGHRRLSIIDLSADSNQPFSDAEQKIWITYNGEIYNFLDIRRRLEQMGVRFRTAGDTEVIVEAYKQWGVDALQQFNGMFAFALWDVQDRLLLLARDRLGEKPLYYAKTHDGLVFASELSALELHPMAAGRRLSMRGLGEYLSLNYTVGETTLRENVRRLPAAHYIVVKDGSISAPRSYWDLAKFYKNKRHDLSIDKAADELNALILDATRLRMISDVPLGAFLSGGIDSAVVVSAMTTLRRAELNKTFSIGFSEAGFSELDAAQETARFFGVDHISEIVRPNIECLLRDVPCAHDEPMADTSAIPTYVLSALSRKSVKVCLSGDGGDELFCGYETYLADRLHASLPLPLRMALRAAGRAFRWIPEGFGKVSFDEKLRRFLNASALPLPHAHVSWRTIFSSDEKRRLLAADLAADPEVCAPPFAAFDPHFSAVDDCHYLDQATYVDTKTWLVDDVLAKVDRQSMAHALEVRAPFLDHRIAEFSASLPVDYKLRGLTTKYVLRRALRKKLPQHVLRAPKRGFNAPLSHWLTKSLANMGKAVTLDGPLQHLLDRKEVEALWSEHMAKSRNHSYKLFTLMCLGLWLSRESAA